MGVLVTACPDDVPQVPSDTESSSDGSTTSGPNPVTLTADSTGGDTTEGSTATTEEPTSSTTTATSDATTSDGSSSGDPPGCGDDVIDGDEVCDGSDLGGSDCTTEGFDDGVLACLPDCSGFDTSACVSLCGNDVIDGDEVCDGSDLDGSDCIAEGFDDGVLGCLPDCSGFDTSTCILMTCGNDVLEGAEICDGTDLAGSSCTSLGFDEGTLGCMANCGAYDTSGCSACGNDLLEGAEICDGTDLAGNDCVGLGLGFTSGTLGCVADCSDYDTSACSTCGNDLVDGSETCDGIDLAGSDCAALGFDGGDLACLANCGSYDTSGCSTCGDGVVGGAELCDGPDLVGQTCQLQGFDYGPLACLAGCAFDIAGCVDVPDETEPNDDGMVAVATNDFSAVDANGPYSANILLHAAIFPAGDDDVFAITNPGPGFVEVRLETFGPNGPGTCTGDTLMEVRTAANVLITSDDDGGINLCSLLPTVALAPGATLYVRIIEFGDDGTLPSYFLDIQFTPVVCGDGLTGPGEQCDDGGIIGGDGCSPTCQIEGVTAEIEPNNTSVAADATGIVISGTTSISGAIGPVGDLDRFNLSLAAAQIVRFESFSGAGVCNGGITTTLRLFDAAGVQIIADTAASGISGCAALVFPLNAGNYYVQVEETGNNAAIASYLLEVAFQANAGTETEPNETLLTANANLGGGGSEVYVFGDHTLNVDSDYYTINVPVAGSSLRLETIEGNRAVETCESNGVDSRITLFDAAGVQLVDDDDDGRGFCSKIDGTGAAPVDASAHTLAAGTYYVQVRASSFAQAGVGGQFVYRLAATVRTP